MIVEMKGRIPGVNVEFYVDPKVITAVYQEQGFEAAAIGSSDMVDGREEEEEEDEVIEEVEP